MCDYVINERDDGIFVVHGLSGGEVCLSTLSREEVTSVFKTGARPEWRECDEIKIVVVFNHVLVAAKWGDDVAVYKTPPMSDTPTWDKIFNVLREYKYRIEMSINSHGLNSQILTVGGIGGSQGFVFLDGLTQRQLGRLLRYLKNSPSPRGPYQSIIALGGLIIRSDSRSIAFLPFSSDQNVLKAVYELLTQEKN
jgi:hypothetical protein